MTHLTVTDGLGAALLLDGLPIAYVSKALIQAQKNYAQMEKEMLAITFGCGAQSKLPSRGPQLADGERPPDMEVS